jgi:uncharacterized protein (DUF608 family)
MNRILVYSILLPALLQVGCSHVEKGQGPGNTGGLPVYTGENLRNIFYPLGGIGTGNLLIGGRGNILEFEIFNRAQRDELPPYMTFFSLWCDDGDHDPVAMILERRHFDNFTNGFGVPRQQLSGLPRFDELCWTGAPPFIQLEFEDQRVPLHIRLVCFSPMIPLDVPNSSIPVGTFTWTVSNPTDRIIEFALAFNISNPFGNLNYRDGKPGHRIRNTPILDGNLSGVYFESLIDPSHKDYGNMAVATDHGKEEIVTAWPLGGWWDDAHLLWGEFSGKGHIPVITDSIVHAGQKQLVSSVLVRGGLAPGATDTIKYYLAWVVPNRKLESSQAFGEAEIAGHMAGNYYSRAYDDALEVLDYFVTNESRLRRYGRKFHDRLAGSSVPGPVIDAAAANLAALTSNLLSRVDNGDVHAWEGLGPTFGCCPGNCTHVWNYAQTPASLFPSLERNMRETTFLTQTFQSGYQCFRTTFPIGDHYFKNVAADGQMGSIMRVYREWKYSGDSLWLAGLWPSVRRALEFAWKGPSRDSREAAWVREMIAWDPNKEGVLRGDQHNTYDINFLGPNMMTGSLYLGAIKACSEMAGYLGDTPLAMEYQELYQKGRERYDELLWNGSWYTQKVEVIDGLTIPARLKTAEGSIKYQYGSGCLADQLLGQYLSFNAGMGYLLDSVKVQKSLQSIFDHNFIPSFADFQNVQRVYALNNEGGLVICTWPDGNREQIPFPYAEETWTGVEYQVAATMIRAGLVDEGLKVTRAVRGRYAGHNRNPYAEIESGFYYARALSSWAVLLALSGFDYDGVSKSIGFNPVFSQENFNSFWSTGSGWGNYLQTTQEIELEVDYGKLIIKRLGYGRMHPGSIPRVYVDGQSVECNPGHGSSIVFTRALELYEGDVLRLVWDD